MGNVGKKDVKRICCMFLIIMLFLPSLHVDASQSKSGNFNTNYSLNGSQADRLVAVALAQQEKTKAQLGYSEAWCADFVSDCAKLAGLSGVIPFDGYCETLYKKVKKAGGQDVSTPQKGDLVFYYCSVCSVHWCHVGIMLDSTRSIEGNYNGKVSLVNGVYKDGSGHSLANGKITRKFVRPGYQKYVTSSPSLHAWISDSAMGNPPSHYRTGTEYYLCYELLDRVSGKRFDEVADANYKIKETFYKPSGSELGFCEYDNDNNWIRMTPTEEGVYRGKVSISGDYSGEVEVSFEVKEHRVLMSMWLSDTKMGTEAEKCKKGSMYYLCYRIYDSDTDELTSDFDNQEYSVKETIYNVDGSIGYSYTYRNSNNNWIAYRFDDEGTYKVQIEFTVNGNTVNMADEYTVAHTHSYTGEITKSATCTTTGIKKYTCKCGSSYTEIIPKTSHVVVIDKAQPATCTVNGKTEGSHCSVCGTVIKAQTTVAKTGHKNTIIKNAKAATCSMEGYTGDTYCVDCGTKISGGSVIGKKEHSWNNGVITTPATATKEGTKTFTCQTCGTTRTETIPVTGVPETKPHVHNYAEKIVKAATCSDEGEKQYVCACGDKYTEIIAKIAHQNTVVKNAKAATCSMEGYTGDIYCADCGTKISDGNVISKTAHTWNEGIITVQATEKENGTKTYTCKECGMTRTEMIPALGSPSAEEETLEEGGYQQSEEQEETLEEGDIVYDINHEAEYEVVSVKGDEVCVEYVEPLNKRASYVKIYDTVETEEGITCRVISVSSNAFKNNKYVRKIDIGNNVILIGAKAFYGCKNLSRINLGNRVAVIESNVFSKCSNLTKLILPKSVLKIGSNAFYSCKKLKVLQIKSTKLTSEKLGKKAFNGIPSGTSVKVPGNKIKTYKKLFYKKGLKAKIKMVAL